MTEGMTLYEEVWECRFPKREVVEEELLDLIALAPDLIKDLRSLFKEAVTDSLANILPENEARALLMLIAWTDFEDPSRVSEALDSILGEGSRILKHAILEEFRVNVHILLGKVRRGVISNGPVPDTKRILRRGPST
jgi:hypothetical protein